MDAISLSSGNKLAGRYRVLQKLGEGSFAETFLAEDEHLPDAFRCVIKKLKTGVEDEAKLKIAKRLFDEEARTLHQLGSHPNIPQLLAHFEEDSEFYLVEEYVAGTSLYQELATGQQWSEGYVTKLMKDILSALSFVHQKQVIHRDIKPSNIIRREKDGQIVLIDFGAVKQVANQAIDEGSQIAPHTVIVGTPGYMPGEQLRGSPRMSSDVYAVGMIGIYALTGLNPALGQLPEDELTAEILWKDRASISPEFASILEKMVAYDFRQRYPSAKEALDALNALALYRQDNAPTILKDPAHSIGVPPGSGAAVNPNNGHAASSSGGVNVNFGTGQSTGQGSDRQGIKKQGTGQGTASSGIIINAAAGTGSGLGVSPGTGSSAALEPTSVGSGIHAKASAAPDDSVERPSGRVGGDDRGSTSTSALEPTSVGTYAISNARPAEISKPAPDSASGNRRAFPLKVVALGGGVLVGLGAIAAFASPNIEPICKALNNCSANVRYGSVYKEASNSAEAALSVLNNAKSFQDLQTAQSQLQQSIQQLNKVPKGVDSYSDAQKLLPNYQKQLKTLQERMTLEKKAQQELQQADTIATKVLTQKKLPTSVAALSTNKAKLQEAIQRIDKIPQKSLSTSQGLAQKQAYLKKSKELDREIQKQAAAEAERQRRAAAAAPQRRWRDRPEPQYSSGGQEPIWGEGSSSPAAPPPAVWNSGSSSVAQDPPRSAPAPAPAPAPAAQEPIWGGDGGGGGASQAAPPPSNGGDAGGNEPLW
ncbi:protein kinase [Altericista sp. CCNU0014]|uniref:protein kinase domain-containing protein n=1 Tax=Altericista sp. CCNU0014 TaxID=3082949 RepID=UPI00384B9B81